MPPPIPAARRAGSESSSTISDPSRWKTRVATALVATWLLSLVAAGIAHAAGGHGGSEAHAAFPPSLDSYQDGDLEGIGAVLRHRIEANPFNLVGTLIFLAAIGHTFFAGGFMERSHRWREEHAEKIRQGEAKAGTVSLRGELFHFLGEVEVVFGLWSMVLMAAIVAFFDWGTAAHYVGETVNFTEAAFVVVIMTLAATRPILRMAESVMDGVAHLLGGSLRAMWMTTLTLGPLLGSFITEPAAMTLSALILSQAVYGLGPSDRLKYATIALLFLNVSVGGTLTHFAAPPVLMVAEPWGWDMAYMFTHFGWRAVVGILISNSIYLFLFRKEFASLEGAYALQKLKAQIEKRYVTREIVEAEFDRVKSDAEVMDRIQSQTDVLLAEIRERMERETLPELQEKGVDPELIHEAFEKRFEEIRLARMQRDVPGVLPESEQPPFEDPAWDQREDPVPAWITVVHVLFLVWTIVNAHHAQLFVLGMLFFLGFAQITAPYQNFVRLRSAMLVGFFLAGLVIHGGVQAWWIAPVLGGLSEVPLMIVAGGLSAFNDNAAITFLSTLVPGFTDDLKHAVLAGAVTGGGLTIIANAPNPAGLSLLKHHFGGTVSPLGLAGWVLFPTLLVGTCLLLL